MSLKGHSEMTSRAGGYPQTPFFFFSLAQRKEVKETSTPSKASPYMGRMQLIPRAGSLHQRFGMAL